MRKLFSLQIAFLLALAIPSGADSAGKHGTLEGTVLPVGISAKIHISAVGPIAKDGSRYYETQPDAEGRFSESLPQGVYQLSVIAEGYVIQSIAVLPSKSLPLGIKDIGLPVSSGKATDIGTITLHKAGFIEGVITSDDPKDAVRVRAFRRSERYIEAYEHMSWYESGVDSKTGRYTLTLLEPGTYDLLIASGRCGVKRFLPSYGPTVKSGPVVAELESRLNDYGKAFCSGDLQKRLSFHSDTNKERYETIRMIAQMGQRNDATSEKKAAKREYHVLSCSAAEDRAVTFASLRSEDRYKATNKLSSVMTEYVIHFWAREQSLWKITGWTWADPPSGPPKPAPVVIFGKDLVGIEVKAGETTSVEAYSVGKSGVRPVEHRP